MFIDKQSEKRLNISISFSGDEAAYWHAKNQPNTSFYIKNLVKEDMKKTVKKSSSNIIEENFEINEIAESIMNW